MDREFELLQANLAANVVRLRKAKKLSQEELALEADVDRSYVSLIETCKCNPSVLMLHKLAKTLDSRVINLLSQLEQGTASSAA